MFSFFIEILGMKGMIAFIGFITFAFFFSYSQSVFNWIESRTLGTREYIMERLELLFMEVPEDKVFYIILSIAFGVSSLAFILFFLLGFLVFGDYGLYCICFRGFPDTNMDCGFFRGTKNENLPRPNGGCAHLAGQWNPGRAFDSPGPGDGGGRDARSRVTGVQLDFAAEPHRGSTGGVL